MYDGRENRGSDPVGEGPDSVRGLTRVQYPLRMKGEGYAWWLKASAGTNWTVEVKQYPKRTKIDPPRVLGGRLR